MRFYRSWLAILLCIISGSCCRAQSSESQPVVRALENTSTGNLVSEEGSCGVGPGGDVGQCMMLWKCMQQGGQQVGPCRHKQLFGTCCLISKNGSTDEQTPKELGSFVKDASDTYEELAEFIKNFASSVISSRTPGTNDTTEEPTEQERSKQKRKRKPNRKNDISLIAIDPLQTGEGCGAIKVSLPQGRIVNGTDADFGEFPWQVSLRAGDRRGYFAHHCGGTLISKSWIATAAHCLQLIPSISMLKVRIGEHDLAIENEKYPYVERRVKRNFTHPKFDFATFKYDIALLELNDPVPDQPNIGFICLPGSDNNLRGLEGWATGWGRLSDEGNLPNVLQKVPLTIMKNKECKNSFKTAGRIEAIPKIFLCAADVGRDACTGDSGGPLQLRDSSGRWFLGGIVSWGIGCARPYHPGVYTRISKFMPFIKNTIINNS